MKKRNFNLSINAFYYCKRCKYTYNPKTKKWTLKQKSEWTIPSIKWFAKQQQKEMNRYIKFKCKEVANKLGYELIPKNKTTQYRHRTSEKILLNGKSYSLQEMQTDNTMKPTGRLKRTFNQFLKMASDSEK